jgi:uncharacterized membrane protein HdeD (DUF308 family)
MKNLIIVIIILFAGACIGVAGYMAYNDKSGWGWFLFAGLIIISGLHTTNNKREADDDAC